jgi:hypothetical protein
MGADREKEVPMSAIGRNERCPCGSGKKAKRCCGARRGPSESELAKAFLATQSRVAARRVARRTLEEVHESFDAMLDLPGRHLSLQVPLPRLLPPEIEALRYAIDEDDDDRTDELVDRALVRVDTPVQRAALARAVLDLADAGTVERDIADVTIVDLDSRRSSAFIRMSLLHAVSVSVGASRTPSGLLVVAR